LNTLKIIISITTIGAFIFVSSFFTNRLLQNDAHILEEKINSVKISTKNKNWETAETEIDSVLKKWPTVESKWALLLDHAEIDNIEEALTKVSEYIEAKNTPLALAELASLKNYINHIPKKESFNLKNIF